MDEVDKALSIGEVAWAIRCAKADVAAAKKNGAPAQLVALRRLAVLEGQSADDEDLPSLTRSAKAWAQVVATEGATSRDREEHGWAELLAGNPRKAAAASDAAILAAAIAWALRRQDAKKLEALTSLVTSELTKKKDLARNVERLEWVIRLLVQAHVDARALAALLPASRVEKEKPAGTPLENARRRVARALTVYDANSPALEMPLYALARAARDAGEHETVIDACRKLVPIQASRKGQEELRERHAVLTDLRRSLTALRRFDEALAVADDADALKAKMQLHLCPDHYARAEIYEAMGDLDRMVEAHLAAVAQHEAGEPPIYGPEASNTELARGWARQAMKRAGREKEANTRFPEKSRARR